MSVQPPSPAGNDFKLPVHQIDATKKRVHPRFVTGFYQNIRVVSMYFLLLLFLFNTIEALQASKTQVFLDNHIKSLRDSMISLHNPEPIQQRCG